MGVFSNIISPQQVKMITILLNNNYFVLDNTILKLFGSNITFTILNESE